MFKIVFFIFGAVSASNISFFEKKNKPARNKYKSFLFVQ